MAGLTGVCIASLAPLVLPATATVTLGLMNNISLYGGLFVFSGLVLWDTKKIVMNAENAADPRELSPINESLNIYLDFINIFVRLLTLSNNKKK